MTFSSPLGLLALLSVPVIVALHMFRNRLKERTVSGLFLFPASAMRSDGGRKRTRLLGSVSLLLECAAAAVAALWLAGLGVPAGAPRHVVVVLDSSGSMAATATAARVGEWLDALVDELEGDAEATVVASGAFPEIALGPRASVDALAQWLAQPRAFVGDHDLAPAVDLAREFAGRGGDVVLLTDRLPRSAAVEDVRVVGCGVPRPNVALGAVRWGEAAASVRVAVVTYGKPDSLPPPAASPAAQLRVYSGERLLANVAVAPLADGEEQWLEVALPPEELRGGAASEKLLRVELPDDELMLDNVAWLQPPHTPVVAVCTQMASGLREQLALARTLAVQSTWRSVDDPRKAQLLLLDREQASQSAAARADQVQVVLGPSASPLRGHLGPYVVDRAHPLLRGVGLEGVGWQSGSGAIPGAVLIASGDKVLVSEELQPSGTRLHVDVAPGAGNVVRAPDWPILFANLFEAARRYAPGLQENALRVGEELVFRSAEALLQRSAARAGTAEYRLVDAAGIELTRSDRGELRQVLTRPGLVRVLAEDGAVLGTAAARFQDARESDLRSLAAFDRPAAVPLAGETRSVQTKPLQSLLALLLMLLVIGNWWWLQRGGGA
ncbi:MAG: BatA domain-containing protein [Planctomycetota bacterium]